MELETDRLLIHAIDYDEMALFLNSPSCLEDALHLTSWGFSLDVQTAMMLSLIYDYTDPSIWLWRTQWLLIEKQRRCIVGRIYCLDHPDVHGRVEIGYSTEMPYRQQGYMKEAVRCFTTWILKNPNTKLVMAKCKPENIASKTVLHACGFLYNSQLNAWTLIG